MPPRGLRPSDREDLRDEEPKALWTVEETDALHEMVKEYIWARRFRKKMGWYLAWILGVPGAILAFWEPLERLLKLFHLVK